MVPFIRPKDLSLMPIIDAQRQSQLTERDALPARHYPSLRIGVWFPLHAVLVGPGRLDVHGNVVDVRAMIDGTRLSAAHHASWRGVLIGVSLLLLISLAIYPFRRFDYELQFLLVLPVVYAGVLAGRVAALVTALLAVVAFHVVDQVRIQGPRRRHRLRHLSRQCTGRGRSGRSWDRSPGVGRTARGRAA